MLHSTTPAEEPATTLVDIDVILRNGGTQARAGFESNHEAVREYADFYHEDGTTVLPPIDVFYDGNSYWLADGFHRHRAAEVAGWKKIECVVHQGTRRDAILFAVGANRAYGLRRKSADKRKAVGMLLADPEWAAKSDRWIAETAGVSNHLVADVRAATGNSPSSTKRTGKDGKTRATKATPAPTVLRVNGKGGAELIPAKTFPEGKPVAKFDRIGDAIDSIEAQACIGLDFTEDVTREQWEAVGKGLGKAIHEQEAKPAHRRTTRRRKADEATDAWHFPPGAIEHWDHNVKRIINKPLEYQVGDIAYLFEQAYLVMKRWEEPDGLQAAADSDEIAFRRLATLSDSIQEMLGTHCPELVAQFRQEEQERKAVHEEWKRARLTQGDH